MAYRQNFKNTFLNVRTEIWICLVLVLATLAIYWQVKGFSFLNYDDRQYVTQNHYVRNGLNLESIEWSITHSHASNWHPLTWMSHMLDCQIYGLDSGRHHLINLFFHILSTVLLFLVFKRMTGALWRSAFVAALFGLHPLHVESVAWVSERKDVLSTFFAMLTIWSYIWYVEKSDLNSYLWVVLYFMLGLMAKPMLVTLPFVFLLLDYWPLKRFQSGLSDQENQGINRPFYFGLIWEKMPLFLLSSASSVVTYFVQKSGSALISTDVIPFHARIANALISYVTYIWKMIWPHNLAVIYPHPRSIVFWKLAIAGLLLTMISVFVFRMRISKPYLTVGWLWFTGTLVPVIGIVQAGSQAMADRYTYVPLIGIFIMITWGVVDLTPKWRYRKIGFSVISGVILIILMITSWLQIRHWSNSVTLFKHAIDVTGHNSIAQLNLGEALAEQGKMEAAVRHYQEALKINPYLIEAHVNLGIYLRGEGKFDEAVDHFLKVLKTKPDDAEARYELADTFEKKGDYKGAVENYLEALRISPDLPKVYNNLGVLMARQNKINEAIVLFNKTLQIDPAYAGAYYNLGKIFANEGRIDEAILNYRKALSLNKDMTQALFHLSWILATHEDEKYRNGQEAVRLAEKLCKITQYDQPLALDALATAYAEEGRYDEAVSTAKRALKQGLKKGPKELVQGLKQRIKLYLNKTPYRKTVKREGNG